jgi:hypothetical protein
LAKGRHEHESQQFLNEKNPMPESRSYREKHELDEANDATISEVTSA